MDLSHPQQNTGISPQATIHPNVQLGENVTVEAYCIIGYPPKGQAPGELITHIGSNTTIRSHSVIYAGVTLGEHCHLGHSCFVREHTKIGDHSSLGINVIVEHHCSIGKNVRLQGQAGLSEYTVIEDDAWIGPRVVTANVPHPTCERAKECIAGPTIRAGAIIGANACISPDVIVGKRALVGSGSVVTKDVAENTVVFGIPAKNIGEVGKLSCKYDMMNGKSPYAVAAPGRPLATATPKKIPLVDLSAQHQALKQNIRVAMDTVILNARFINGKEVKAFEEAFADFCGVHHAVGVSSGTDALILALQALNIGPGDEVITSTHTFIATAEAIVAVGATPVFVDVGDNDYQLSSHAVAQCINERTKAIIAVHLYGHLAAMPEILAIAEKHELFVIEDAAQAHGASLAGRKAGAWGHLACFSFYPGKNLGAYGDAGAIVSNDPALAKKIAKLRDHGRAEKYIHDLVGSNSRMDTLQAAVLGVKLKQLKKWNNARRAIAAFYCEQLKDLPITLPTAADDAEHVYHLFVIRTEQRAQLQQALSEAHIASGIHYPVPLHLQPAFANLGYSKGDFPNTERLATQILSLPIFPEMTPAQMQRVTDAVRHFFNKG